MKTTKTYTRETFKEFNEYYGVMIEWDLNSFCSNGNGHDCEYSDDGYIYGYDYYGNEYTTEAESCCGEVSDYGFEWTEKQ